MTTIQRHIWKQARALKSIMTRHFCNSRELGEATHFSEGEIDKMLCEDDERVRWFAEMMKQAERRLQRREAQTFLIAARMRIED
ncbi:hypothetical protein [Novosphingobium sp.]|uniref:hypothetical protein n=1 Tax=Novosphingobium sp. TaxID=1874826 RepID=UPI003B518C0F